MNAAEIEECIRVLETLVENRAGLAEVDEPTRNRLLTAAGRVSRPERNEQRLLARALKKQRKRVTRYKDEAQLALTGIRKLRAQPVFIRPLPEVVAESEGSTSSAIALSAPELKRPRACYVCKELSVKMHFFYDQMCGPCGDFNFAKRSQTADLHGRVALITGARVKIGYQAGLFLLRAGARVIVTTRFPRNAAQRYAKEPDFEQFQDRLVIYGVDLRYTPSVERFADHVCHTEQRLDFILHNACQTVRRPSGFYRHLMTEELGPHHLLPAPLRTLVRELCPAPALSQVPVTPADLEISSHIFPTGALDADLQQVDLRGVNSWRLALHEVSTVELLEVQLVNAIAPFVLNARLKPLMLRDRSFDKHIVNVSAMEGQFYRRFKTDKHPHTNMAKAALNMMTRTSAADFIKDGVHMNSVDTGWVTDEDPVHIARRKTEENGFHPPLDIVDGAARIVDPIFDGLNTGEHRWGQFLKDYQPAPW